MAVLDDNSGLATVQPTSDAPQDLQNIQTSPDQFGGLISQGEDKLGAGSTQAGLLYSAISAQDANNTYLAKSDELLHGKITTGPDGTPQVVGGLMNMKGQDALAAAPGIQKQLDDLYDQTKGGLYTLDAQQKFDENSRRYRTMITGAVSSYADQQNKQYGVDTANDTISTNKVAAGNFELNNNQAGLADTLNNFRNAYKQLAALKGEGPEGQAQAENKADQDFAVSRITARAATDPVGAQKLLDQNQSVLAGTPAYDQLADRLRVRNAQQTGYQAAETAINGMSGAAVGADGKSQPSVPPTSGVSVKDAIFQQESGSNPNAPNSVNGAVGQRIIADLQTKYPNDPARVAVGYFSGPGNVAPIGSSTPWINDSKDANGKSVSGYVNDVSNRMGGVAAASAAKADAYSRVLDMNLDPEARQYALQEVTRRITAAQTASEATAAVQKQQRENIKTNYIRQIAQGDYTGAVAKAATDPSLQGEDIENITNFANAQAARAGAGDAAHYGSGFNDALAKINLPNGDPDRITSVGQLISRAGPTGDLNADGVEKLTSIMGSLKKPAGAAEAATQKGMLDYAKQQLSFEVDEPFYKIPDPKGMGAFNTGFIPSFYKAWDADVAAGKNPVETMTKERVDGLIAPFKRTEAQLQADQLGADAIAPSPTAGGQTVKAADLGSWNDILSAYHSGKISRNDAEAQAIKLGIVRQTPPSVAVPAVPQVPLAQ